MSENDITRTTMVDALEQLRRQDVPQVEFLVLREVMGWILSDQNPGRDYDRRHAALLGGALFSGLDNAAGVSLEAQPAETPMMAVARDSLVTGAHELASHGDNGLSMLLDGRVIPAMIGELERSASDPTTQGACTWAYLLYSVAMGERHDHEQAVMTGFLEAFDAWSSLLATL